MEKTQLPAVPVDPEKKDSSGISEKLTNIDPKFILEAASGLEEVEEIAPRYGYSEEDVKVLKAYKPFLIEVEKVKAELYRSGKTFKLKAAVMADSVLEKVYGDAIRPDTPVALRLEALKTLSKLADLEPKQLQGQGQGTGFSITINLPSSIKSVNDA